MRLLTIILTLLTLTERLWKHAMVVSFFRRPVPPVPPDPPLVSIMQPILSGDPTLPTCLEQNLEMQTRYPLEFIWLVDSDDAEGQRICHSLIARHPQRVVRLLIQPPPDRTQNPKMVKLIAGAQVASGEILCVLDDDTCLPDAGLERCLPFLDQPGIGLAFGLPYYRSFGNLWSSLVAAFVNSHSLLTYVPYTRLTPPLTINGMFYAIKRPVFAAVNGFNGLESTLADDFAVANRLRDHGYHLAQTPLCHGISTTVSGPRHYFSLIQRWFIFPRESLMRYLQPREQVLLYGVALLPVFFPWLVLLAAAAHPRRWTLGYALLYFGYNYAICAHFNRAYFNRAMPWQRSWLVPLVQLSFPAQVLVALFAPQRIIWRGHVMQVERGGGLRWLRRRSEGA